MTTPTITEYAVQVEMFPGEWLFVMDERGEKIQVTRNAQEARAAARIWDPGHCRVVFRWTEPRTTPWRLV